MRIGLPGDQLFVRRDRDERRILAKGYAGQRRRIGKAVERAAAVRVAQFDFRIVARQSEQLAIDGKRE